MKTIRPILLFTVLMAGINGSAQTTAMDFTLDDCNGNPQHLFADLDAGQAVIIEYFMTSCASCVVAGDALEAMKSDLLAEFPGMVKSYAFGYTNSYSCATVSNWVTTNGYSAIPSDSGATQVAYYGGFGMPTVVIVAGSSHLILGSPYIGFSVSDTTLMADDIRDFFASAGVEALTGSTMLNIYPNPANTDFRVDFTLDQESDVQIRIIDLTGKVILGLPVEKLAAGPVSKLLNVSEIAAGNYILQISINEQIENKKISIGQH
jgi:hypothetical protein